MKQQLSKFIFCFLYFYVVRVNANCVPNKTESAKKTTKQELTTVQTSSTTTRTYYDGCEKFYGPCSCMYTHDCKCQCTTDNANANMFVTFQGLPPTQNLETVTTTRCPNKCWCGFSNYYSCDCNCPFNLAETPNVVLTWDEIGTDLDLHVIDPNGEEIYYSHQSSASGGRLYRDIQTGPNAVEFVSWGINHSNTRRPNGIYQVYLVGYRTSRQTPYSVAILEYPDQDWKYFNGEITNKQRILVYQFNISSTNSDSLNWESTVNFNGVCGLIYNDECDCGYDIYCNCACQNISTTTKNLLTTVSNQM